MTMTPDSVRAATASASACLRARPSRARWATCSVVVVLDRSQDVVDDLVVVLDYVDTGLLSSSRLLPRTRGSRQIRTG